MNKTLQTCVKAIEEAGKDSDRDFSMPGNPRYQPEDLKPFLGYDQWALFLATVEIQWLVFLQEIGYINSTDVITADAIQNLFTDLRTRDQDALEKTTGHDINALIALMKESSHLPESLKPYIHHGLTSYDTVETARALQLKMSWENVLWPSLKKLDSAWRKKIEENQSVLQMGRTHLQDALPITVGVWLSFIHDRFHGSASQAAQQSSELTGKIAGAVGTSASLEALGITELYTGNLEEHFLTKKMGLAQPRLSTQIVAPERTVRFFHELVLLSGTLGQLGDDARILQSSRYGELTSVSSTSSTMAHKKANPIAAENMASMHTTIIAEFMKPLLNLRSDLQRDLRGSSPARDYIAILIYAQQQIQTAIRLLENMTVDEDRCHENFAVSGPLVMAELLFLELEKAGFAGAHTLVNKKVVPHAAENSCDLVEATRAVAADDATLKDALDRIPSKTLALIQQPEKYLGSAVKTAAEQSKKSL